MEKLAITQTQKNQMMSDAGPHVQELLLVMDTDKNGKISKQEWMKFMEAECDRLDENKTGELSPQSCSVEGECQPEAIRGDGQVSQDSIRWE